MDIPRKYWPFDVLPPNEQTEQHRREIAFLNAAHQAGCKAFAFGVGNNYGAIAEDGREGEIIWRGKARWEIRLYDGDVRTAAAYLDDFACAGKAVMAWLNGMNINAVCEMAKDHVAVSPGATQSPMLSHDK